MAEPSAASASKSEARSELAARGSVTCKCGKRAVYLRKYEGRAYCKECFLHQIERQFKRAVRKHSMLTKGETVGVGLSGGKDSATLLYLMDKLAKSMQLKLVAITVDEGIEGYRPKTIVAAKKLCRQLGIRHRIVSFRKEFGVTIDGIPKKLLQDMPACSWCGVHRRRALNNAARELECSKLAVGHNLDDESQSAIMGFVRGDMNQFSRLSAATAESDGLVPRIKPLREIPEKEITAYAVLRELPFSSAECPNSYTMIRRKAGEFLNNLEFAHPGTKHQVLKFYDKLQSKIAPSPSAVPNACNACGEPCSGATCRVCEMKAMLKGAKK